MKDKAFKTAFLAALGWETGKVLHYTICKAALEATNLIKKSVNEVKDQMNKEKGD